MRMSVRMSRRPSGLRDVDSVDESKGERVAANGRPLGAEAWAVKQRAWHYGVRSSKRYGLRAVRLEDFVDQKQIGEQRAQVNRRVEVVDHLRADRRLREDELNCGL